MHGTMPAMRWLLLALVVTGCDRKTTSGEAPAPSSSSATSSARPAVSTSAAAGPTCGTGLAVCNASCVALASDARHCGRCSNACRGGICAQGVCRAAELVAKDVFSYGVTAFDAEHAYLGPAAAGKSYYRVSYAGKLEERSWVQSFVPRASDGTHLYGCKPDDSPPKTSGERSGKCDVLSMPVAGGAVKKIATIERASVEAVDATDVYLVRADAATSSNGGELLKMPKAGGEPVVLRGGVSFATELAVSGGSVFYRHEDGRHSNDVMRLDPGKEPVSVARGAGARRFAVVGRFLYFNRSDEELVRVRLSDGALETAALMPAHAAGDHTPAGMPRNPAGFAIGKGKLLLVAGGKDVNFVNVYAVDYVAD
jgi:hypothetical protein